MPSGFFLRLKEHIVTCVVDVWDLIFIPQYFLCRVQRHGIDRLRLELTALITIREDFLEEFCVRCPFVIL